MTPGGGILQPVGHAAATIDQAPHPLRLPCRGHGDPVGPAAGDVAPRASNDNAADRLVHDVRAHHRRSLRGGTLVDLLIAFGIVLAGALAGVTCFKAFGP